MMTSANRRRVIAFALVLGLIGAVSAGPAIAKKKKKKKPPITFEASGSFAVGQPASIEGASITGNEFAETCAIPVTQGLDAFVVELSDEISEVTSIANLSGNDATGLYDLDMYYFDADCTPVGATSTAETNEIGAFPAGTKFVLVSAFAGVQLEFKLAAVEMKG